MTTGDLVDIDTEKDRNNQIYAGIEALFEGASHLD
jgi:hypothetical protein